jgi:hypothetical protein
MSVPLTCVALGDSGKAEGGAGTKWLIFLAKGVAKLQPLTVS